MCWSGSVWWQLQLYQTTPPPSCVCQSTYLWHISDATVAVTHTIMMLWVLVRPGVWVGVTTIIVSVSQSRDAVGVMPTPVTHHCWLCSVAVILSWHCGWCHSSDCACVPDLSLYDCVCVCVLLLLVYCLFVAVMLICVCSVSSVHCAMASTPSVCMCAWLWVRLYVCVNDLTWYAVMQLISCCQSWRMLMIRIKTCASHTHGETRYVVVNFSGFSNNSANVHKWEIIISCRYYTADIKQRLHWKRLRGNRRKIIECGNVVCCWQLMMWWYCVTLL